MSKFLHWPILLLCPIAFAQVQGETPALTPFVGELGTHIIIMPTYTYSRMPGTLGLSAEEEIWRPGKWKNRQIYSRFVPIMDWEIRERGAWFYTGNELGDELWQELAAKNSEPNRTPMLYGGFATPSVNGFYATAQFNQIDHFSEATFKERKQRINSQKFSWFGENLPAYSGLFGGFGYSSNSDFFKNASVLAGSEYLWAHYESEWVPIRISPRVEGNAGFYFMESEIEMHAAAEKYQIKDSSAEDRSFFGLRLKGSNSGGGLYISNVKNKENFIAWTDFSHRFFDALANKGFIAFEAWPNKKIELGDIRFADSLEYEIGISKSTSLMPGILLNKHGAKLYAETAYKFRPFFAKTKAYQTYAANSESIGFDTEIAYKSALAEAGAAYSKEFFEYYREDIFYDIKPAENSAKLFLKYSFLKNLIFTHEWVYLGEWLWNAQIEQKIPKQNTSLYAVWLHIGGSARFYCGLNASL